MHDLTLHLGVSAPKNHNYGSAQHVIKGKAR